MIDRLFSPAFGNRPQIFVGRRDTINDVMSGLKEMPGSKERAVLLLGQRGYGKTVLLLELADEASQAGYVVASPTVVSTGMLNRILEKLSVAAEPYLPRTKKQLTGGSIGALGFSASLSFQGSPTPTPSFARQLSILCEKLNKKDKGVLILIDELVANQEELRQLIIAYQEMVGEGRNIAIIMAGLPSAVASTLQDHVLTFLNRAKKINLEPLKTNEIDCYYQEAFAKLGVRVPDDLRKKASDESQGSPYLMQLIGHYITLGASQEKAITEKDLLEAVRRAKDDYKNDICQTSLAPLSEKDLAFLLAMSQCEGEEIGISSIQEQMHVTSSYVQLYKRRLIQSGIIEPAGRAKVRFAIPFLQEYLLSRSF